MRYNTIKLTNSIQWIKKNAQRVAPFRKHTIGYTGQKRTAYRENFRVNLINHQMVSLTDLILACAIIDREEDLRDDQGGVQELQ